MSQAGSNIYHSVSGYDYPQTIAGSVYGSTHGNGIRRNSNYSTAGRKYMQPYTPVPAHYTHLRQGNVPKELSDKPRNFLLPVVTIIGVISLCALGLAIYEILSNDSESTQCPDSCPGGLPREICSSIINYYEELCIENKDESPHRGQSAVGESPDGCREECAVEATCRNISGSLMCKCGPDFEGDGLASGSGCTEKAWDFEVDLSTGQTVGDIDWRSSLRGGSNCDRQGVIKLDLSSAPMKILEVQAQFSHNRFNSWHFNLGDSPSNNGWSGDGGHNFYDAEFWVSGGGPTVALETSDNIQGPNRLWQTNLHAPGQDITTVLFTVGHFSASVDNFHNVYFSEVNHDGLFALDGRDDPEGSPNYDLYLGMNRVISSSSRSGYGLCYIKARIL